MTVLVLVQNKCNNFPLKEKTLEKTNLMSSPVFSYLSFSESSHQRQHMSGSVSTMFCIPKNVSSWQVKVSHLFSRVSFSRYVYKLCFQTRSSVDLLGSVVKQVCSCPDTLDNANCIVSLIKHCLLLLKSFMCFYWTIWNVLFTSLPILWKLVKLKKLHKWASMLCQVIS